MFFFCFLFFLFFLFLLLFLFLFFSVFFYMQTTTSVDTEITTFAQPEFFFSSGEGLEFGKLFERMVLCSFSC